MWQGFYVERGLGVEGWGGKLKFQQVLRDLLLAKTEPMCDAGSASVRAYLRKSKKYCTASGREE